MRTHLLRVAGLVVFAGVIGHPTSGMALWINEIHYDNAGGDVGEFVEVAGPAGLDTGGFSLALYNGSASQLKVYDTIVLSGVIDDEGAGFGALSFLADPSIQNGAPDGIALLNGTTVLEFLSYEGSFTAAEGPATGMTSTDIGVAETSATPIGFSLQLTGVGTGAADFSWTGPADDSPGSLNVNQRIPTMPPGGSVPDSGATFLFFGLALSGLVAGKKRRRRQ